MSPGSANGPVSDTAFYRFNVSHYASNGFVERMDPQTSNFTDSILWRPRPASTRAGPLPPPDPSPAATTS